MHVHRQRIDYKIRVESRSEATFRVIVENGFLRRDEMAFPIRHGTWTKLDVHKCPNCPLDASASPYCPAATAIEPVVERFSELASYAEVSVQVETAERNYHVNTTLQRALSSLIGLQIAASGCPHTASLRPLAQFHLPFSTETETLYRVASSYFLAQYLHDTNRDGMGTDGLRRIYAELQVINQNLSKRLRSAAPSDAAVNAIVLLDLFAKAVPDAIFDDLEQFRSLGQDR